MKRSSYVATAAIAATITAVANAGMVQTIDFDDLGHGQIIDNEYAAQGVTISAMNFSNGPDLAVAFDTDIIGSTSDPDLQFNGGWAGGNIADQSAGRILIIQENNNGNDGDFVSDPDDEGSRPAGKVVFEFDKAITSLGFDLIDFEDGETIDSTVVSIFNGLEQRTIDFSSFDDPGLFNVPGFDPGNRHANNVPLIDLVALGLTDGATRVEFNFGGSMGIDNVQFIAVPTPTAAAAGLIGLGLLAARRRRDA
ncbi:MAG: hypothetical protein AAFY08_02345 [Planctomycetota bacterium]